MSQSPIPVGAADRIIRNPHSLPRIPQPLAGIVAHNRHQDRLRQYAEDAYQMRRNRLENQRAQLIVSSQSAPASFAARATPSPPPSPSLNAVSRIQTNNGRPNRTRRSHSVHSRSPPPVHHVRDRSHSFSSSSSDAVRELFADPRTKRRSSLYLADVSEVGELQHLPLPSEFLSGPWLPGHSYPFSPKIFSNNPEERVKQRCYFSKRPSPAWKSRNFELNKQGELWTCHPSWHRFMRDEYKVNGQEEVWRDERNRFLQAFRRERQFQKQAHRRMSSSF